MNESKVYGVSVTRIKVLSYEAVNKMMTKSTEGYTDVRTIIEVWLVVLIANAGCAPAICFT